MTNFRSARRLAIALTVVSAVLLSTQQGWAEHCSNRTTEGTYTVVGEGFLSTGPNTPLVPAKLLSLVTADANGTYTGTGTITVGGQVFVQRVVGTQLLQSDCSGSITYRQTLGGQPAPDLHFTFIVSEHGDRIDGLAVDPGTVFSAVLRRLER